MISDIGLLIVARCFTAMRVVLGIVIVLMEAVIVSACVEELANMSNVGNKVALSAFIVSCIAQAIVIARLMIFHPGRSRSRLRPPGFPPFDVGGIPRIPKGPRDLVGAMHIVGESETWSNQAPNPPRFARRSF